MGAGGVTVFAASAVGLAGLAAMVGEGTEQLGRRLGPRATGVLQSGLGNLPEFFIGIFALRAGLLDVVRAALVGSILANTLLVLGLAFLLGGLRHGPQRFGTDQTRLMSTLLILAVAALAIPTIATSSGGPRIRARDGAVRIRLDCSPRRLRRERTVRHRQGVGRWRTGDPGRRPAWPMTLAVGSLLLRHGCRLRVGLVRRLSATRHEFTRHVETFAGLVVVAIAGNAVENVVGVQAMLADKGDLAISVILNSSLQVALALAPVLVLVSLVYGWSHADSGRLAAPGDRTRD